MTGPSRPAGLRFDPAREEAELRAYLGDGFELDRLRGYEQQLDEEFEMSSDEASFYRSSQGYLYNLTAFAMTGTKLPYLDELTGRVAPGSRLLDYGCGIGSDGLLLVEAGYDVEFADFDNPSVEYLRWRLAQRGLNAPIHDLDRGVPAGFDAAFAFDVIEHVDDPVAFLEELEARAGLVLVNLLEDEPGETPLHRKLPVGDLVARASGLDLISYRILHGRSHLLCYRPAAVGPLRRATTRARVAVERARRRR